MSPIEFISDLPYESWQECDVDLSQSTYRPLSVEEEQLLFRQMNLAYWAASQVQHKLGAGPPDSHHEAELSRLIARAEAIRDKLARSFYKLSYSIAGRFANRMYSFDELASEGHFILLRAIARFNPERGFRFSTYAMHAIQRRLYRYIHQRTRQRKFAQTWSDTTTESADRRWTLGYEQRVTLASSALERLLCQLTPRERYVIRSRYGWGREFEPRTLQSIADELNVSRERVRQLENRAIRKLRSLAEPLDVRLGA